MSDEEFAGLGLAPGVVTGARSFKVDKLGRLTGIHYPQVWMPGENAAECLKKEDTFASGGIVYPMSASYSIAPTIPPPNMPRGAQIIDQQFDSYSGIVRYRYLMPDGSQMEELQRVDPYSLSNQAYYYDPPRVKKEKPKAKPPHTMDKCQCGFYAYYDGSDDYHKPDLVSGVIEGWGEALIGTRGFRVTKARIVALYVPTSVSEATGFKVARNYAEIPEFDSFRAMVTAFPADGGEHAVKVVPDADSDFWTRKA